jgi:aminopeptidase S
VRSSASRRGVPSITLVFPDIRIPVVGVARRALGGGGAARVRVDAVERKTRTENVIAETPGGSGERVVMAGGHLDSVISGPGINDNGSGVALLIEAAEAIGPNPPGARVRLGFWAAEELALVGSRRYVRSLGAGERRRVRAYLNFDMVGSPNPVPQLYGDGDPRLSAVLRQAAGGAKLGEADVAGASDHAPFDQAGVPVNGLYTGADERGPGGRPRDPCYHLMCDTERGVNLGVLLRMARTASTALETLSTRQAK